MGNLPDGPFATEREAHAAALAAISPDSGRVILSRTQNRLLFERACEAAGVELGPYDLRILDWLANYEDSTCAVIAGLVARAAAMARPGPRWVTFDLTADDHAEMRFVLTQALEDFAIREREQTAWEDGNSSRKRWADLADAMRAQVESTLDGSR
jgi:hypothetical protein